MTRFIERGGLLALTGSYNLVVGAVVLVFQHNRIGIICLTLGLLLVAFAVITNRRYRHGLHHSADAHQGVSGTPGLSPVYRSRTEEWWYA